MQAAEVLETHLVPEVMTKNKNQKWKNKIKNKKKPLGRLGSHSFGRPLFQITWLAAASAKETEPSVIGQLYLRNFAENPGQGYTSKRSVSCSRRDHDVTVKGCVCIHDFNLIVGVQWALDQTSTSARAIDEKKKKKTETSIDITRICLEKPNLSWQSNQGSTLPSVPALTT